MVAGDRSANTPTGFGLALLAIESATVFSWPIDVFTASMDCLAVACRVATSFMLGLSLSEALTRTVILSPYLAPVGDVTFRVRVFSWPGIISKKRSVLVSAEGVFSQTTPTAS